MTTLYSNGYSKIPQDINSLHQKVEEFQAILESSFDGILVTDANGNILMVNKAYERLTGMKTDEMLGKNMRDFLNPKYMPKSVALMVVDEKKPITIPQVTRNGRNIMVTGNPVFDKNGDIYRVVTNVRDITEIYQLRQELERAHAMEDLYYKLENERIKNKNRGPIAISNSMQDILTLSEKVSSVDATVLIMGESGVGKEVIARYIHDNSPRSNSSFITINCGAIPEQLLESELFGYVGGAFTGSNKNGKAGLFEMAQGGTLFLDEIGELPLNLQVKILRALETREIIKVGGNKPISVDTRILAATNRNLPEMVHKGEFRSDLFYRLNVVQINIPPLRDRKEDIAPLSIYFLTEFNTRYHQKKKLPYEVIKELEKYIWPGNIRELKNIIEQMVVLSNDDYIQFHDLPWFNSRMKENEMSSINVNGIIPLKNAIEEVEKQILMNAMKKYSTSREIAKVVGIDQSNVIRKINKYRLKNN